MAKKSATRRERKRNAVEKSPERAPEAVAPPAGERGTARSLKAFSAIGVLAAALIAVGVNVLVARYYKRWDWTSSGLYTLSGATKQTLSGLSEPVDVIVFLSQSDNLTLSVRHMLTAYGAETQKLRPRFVDPDKNPAEFMALQQKYGIVAGKTDDGRLVTDASIVIARGDKHWYITTDDMVAYDENDGRVRPRLEQALTEGIRNVLGSERAKLCFSTGHQEISIDDGGPDGLAELRFRFEKNNYEVVNVDLSSPSPKLAFNDCRTLVIAGPQVRFSDRAAERAASYLKTGGNVLILANALLDDDMRIVSSGLDPITKLGGMALGNDLVIEADPKARLPQGLGETFFANPKRHDVTKGLVRDDELKVDYKLLMSRAESVRALPGKQPDVLVRSSDQSFAINDVRPFVEQGAQPKKQAADAAGPLALAMSAELPKPAGSKAPHGPRLLVVGSANLAGSANWRDPVLTGNRLFMESALAWLSSRPAIVSVPEKPSHDAGLSLTEESLAEVFRYVTLYMPGAALALGVFVMFRRRSKEKKSRAAAARKGVDDEQRAADHGESEASDEQAPTPEPDEQATDAGSGDSPPDSGADASDEVAEDDEK